MKKFLFTLIVLFSLSSQAQSTLPDGKQVQWIPAETPIDWEMFSYADNGEDEDFKLKLIQYGGYSNGNCLNSFTPSGDNEDEFYVYFPSDNLLAHQGTLDGSFGYTATPSEDGLTLNLTNQRNLLKKTIDKNYQGWIKLLYFGTNKEGDGTHVYLFTLDNNNTYRILEAVEVTD